MLITAKFASKCPVCEARIAVGERVEWSRGARAIHAACAAPAAPPEVTVAELEALAAASRADRLERERVAEARAAAERREVERLRAARVEAERLERERVTRVNERTALDAAYGPGRAAAPPAAPIDRYPIGSVIPEGDWSALGFPRAATRTPTPAPVATAPRIRSRDIVAGAAADGHGALTGWRGDGALPRTEILAALRDAGLPEDWAPASKSSEGHAGKACGDKNLAGYVVRRVKAKDLPRWARTLKARWEIFRATGDRATLLTVDLHTDGNLSGAPDDTRAAEGYSLFDGILADYTALRDGEIYEAGDVTAWLSRTLRTRTGAVAFGVGYYLPDTGRDVASALVTALSARWGSGWIHPLLPVATSTELRTGVARSLIDEVSGIKRALEVAREAAKKTGKDEIGPARAATLIKELEAVHERVGGYRVLCGDEVIRPVVADIAALLATLAALTTDASVRFALLDIPDEVAAAPVAEGPSIAERAATTASDRRRAPSEPPAFDVAAEIARGAAPAIATGAVISALPPTPAPVAVKRPPTEPPAERTSTDERFSLLELD